MNFHGIVPPVLTPLHPDGSLDLPSLDRLVDHLVDAGVDGLFVLGSSGQVAYFTDADRDAITARVVERAGGRVPVVAGAMDLTATRVVEQGRRLAALGVDGVVVTAPLYALNDDAEIACHFRMVAAGVDVPVIAYDVPVRVGRKLSLDLLLALGAEGTIKAVKDSSGDDVGFRRLVARNAEAGHPLDLLSGHEVMCDAMGLLGADGAVPGLGNVDPAGYVRLWKSAQAGDWAAAAAEQARLERLFRIVDVPRSRSGDAGGIGVFKVALAILGVIDSPAMPAPLETMGAAETTAVAKILADVGLSLTHVVAIDLGGTKTAAALVSDDGSLSHLLRVPTPAALGPDAVLDAVAGLVRSVMDQAGASDISGVGIGTAGVVDGAGRIISATETFASWVGTDLVSGIQTRLGRRPDWPVAVRNDVDAHALGELWLGAGRGVDSMLMVAAGTGVGGAVVVNGQLWRGAHFVAGEIGHVPVPGAEGMRCPCGRPGHLEALAAGPAIGRSYSDLTGRQLGAAEVARLANAGDPIACDVITAAAAGLGRAIAGIVTTLDPDRVVVGGGVAEAGDVWWQALRAAYRAELVESLAGVPLIQAELGTTAPLLGAALAAFEATGLSPREKEKRS